MSCVTFALSLLRLVDRLYPEQLLLLLITCGCAIPVALTLLLAHAAHTQHSNAHLKARRASRLTSAAAHSHRLRLARCRSPLGQHSPDSIQNNKEWREVEWRCCND